MNPYISHYFKGEKFIPNAKHSRVPAMSGWSKKGVMQYQNLLDYDDPRLKDRVLKEGLNVAVALGYSDLVIIDPETPEVTEMAFKMLPNDTYIEGTPSNGTHFAYRCKALKDNIKVAKIINGDEIVYLDVICKNHQCHIYPSKYDNKKTGEIKQIKLINDNPPKEIELEKILSFVNAVRERYGAQKGLTLGYDKRYTQKITKQKHKLPSFKELEYNITHLKGFDKLRQGTALKGDEYTPYIKQLWYTLWGLPLARDPIIVNEIYTDTRVHTLFVLPSGGGKKNLLETEKTIAEKLGLIVIRPTSLHPEQLVGAVKKRKANKEDKDSTNKSIELSPDGHYIIEKYPGYFNEDILQIEEGDTLINPKTPLQEEVNRYTSTAGDPIGRNEVVKRPVDILQRNALKYYPPVKLTVVNQPHRYDSHTTRQGLTRRFVIVYRPLSNNDNSEGFIARLKGSFQQNQSILHHFADSIKETIDKHEKQALHFNPDLFDRFHSHHKTLVSLGKSIGQTANEYSKIIDYQLQNRLITYSIIQAFSRGLREVDERSLDAAFVDLYELQFGEYYYIQTKTIGTLDYDESNIDLDESDRKVLSWLYEQGARAEDTSSTSIADYTEYISKIYDVGERQARNIKAKHLKNNWIQEKKAPKISKIWLKEGIETLKTIGEIEEIEERKSYKALKNYYYSICECLDSISIAPISPISKSPSKPDKKASPGKRKISADFHADIFKEKNRGGL